MAKKTFADILKTTEGYVIDARRECVVPVLVQDPDYTPEERMALAELSVALTEIENRITELSSNENNRTSGQ